jgi:hypothetical protein
MSVYISNIGEIAALKSILLQRAITIGLYSNSVIPDGSSLFSTLTELTTGASYGYAPKPLENVVKESATPTAGMWTIVTNSAGKASAVYGAAALSWVFLAPDVALLPTVYGVFGWSQVLPFTAGLHAPKVGGVIRQGAVSAIVTGVNVTSGSWGLGTAAGDIYIKNQVGVFVAGAASLIEVSNPTLVGEIKTIVAIPTAAGTGYAVGEIFTITEAGASGGVGRVTAISGGGATGPATAVELLAGGAVYTAAAGKATVTVNGAGANLTVEVSAVIASGPAVVMATLAGDSNKVLIFVESLTTPIPVTTLGQSIFYTPTLSMATG